MHTRSQALQLVRLITAISVFVWSNGLPYIVTGDRGKFYPHPNIDEEYYLEDVGRNEVYSEKEWNKGKGDCADSVENKDVIVVATVKGDILGISRSNGDLLWKHSRRSKGPTKDNEEEIIDHTKDHNINALWPDEDWNRLMSPIVSTSTTTKTSSSEAHTSAVPSVDGKVFLTPPMFRDVSGTQSSSHVPLAVTEQASSIRHIVDKSPFFDSIGRLYVGNRLSTAAAIDRDTGEILRLIKGEASAFADNNCQQFRTHNNKQTESNGRLECGLPTLQGRNVVWIGRVDHSVTVYNARTGTIDVSFSSSEILSLSDMIGAYVLLGGSTTKEDIAEETLHAQNEFYARVVMQQQLSLKQNEISDSSQTFFAGPRENIMEPVILSTPGGKLALIQAEDGEIRQKDQHQDKANSVIGTDIGASAEAKSAMEKAEGGVEWVANNGSSFESPVAFAVSSETGKSIPIGIVPDAPMQSTSESYLGEQFRKEFDLIQQPRSRRGHNSGRTNPTGESRIIFGSLPESRQLFALPLSGGGGDSTSVPGSNKGRVDSAAVLKKRSSVGSGPLSVTKSFTVPPVRPFRDVVQGDAEGPQTHQPYVTEASNQGVGTNKQMLAKKALSAWKCNEQSPNYPACLIRGRDSIAPLPRLMKEEELSAETDTYHTIVDRNTHHEGLNVEFWGNNESRKGEGERAFDLFLLVITYWGTPVLAFVCFVAFELGRRERLKFEFETLAFQMNIKLGRRDAGNAQLQPDNLITDDDGGTQRLLSLTNEEVDIGKSDVTNVAVMEPNHVDHVIKVSDEILGYGGHGTVVYKGTLDGRRVAVKRMLKTYHASAEREIRLLIESDGHPNVVRYFMKQVRGDFVYLALEFCDLSLSDLIFCVGNNGNAQTETSSQNDIISIAQTRYKKWIKNVLYQISAGVRHLHGLRIVHRDLKPQNILLAFRNRREDPELMKLIENRSSSSDGKPWIDAVCSMLRRDQLVPKISDMGLGKQLVGQSSSFEPSNQLSNGILHHGSNGGSSYMMGGPGSVGWQAPEVMALRSTDTPIFASEDVSASSNSNISLRQCRCAVDIFSLGCVFHCTLLPGAHPFGKWYEREANIMRGKADLLDLMSLSAEAYELIKSMLSRAPSSRPTAEEVCDHPFFWKSTKRLTFLSELSDRLESSTESELDYRTLLQIEANAKDIVGLRWDDDLDPDLLTNVSKFRTYDTSSVRDCLRMIRNKYHHFDELPRTFKERNGFHIDDLMEYFDTKFPRLLMHCFMTCRCILNPGDPIAVKFSIRPFIESAREEKMKFKSNSSVFEQERENNLNEDQAISDSYNTQSLRSESIPLLCTENIEASDPVVVSEASDLDCVQMPNGAVADSSQNVILNMSVEKNSTSSENAPIDENVDNDCAVAAEYPSTSPATAALGEVGTSSELPQLSDGDVSCTNSILTVPEGVVVWEGSNAANVSRCRGWFRSESEWEGATGSSKSAVHQSLTKWMDDPKIRTRLCNHWDQSNGSHCPMRRKNKCIFAHGPVELRVKEGKRKRWGTLVDDEGNNNNPFHSGGEDTYGAAFSIENERKEEGKWNSNSKSPQKAKIKKGKKQGNRTRPQETRPKQQPIPAG